MIRKEIHCYRDFVQVAYSVDDPYFASVRMSEFRRFCPVLYSEFRRRFLKETAENEAMGYKHKDSIFD